MRLLLVEDDRDLSQFIAEGLNREGFAVDAAYDGREAVALAGTKAFDVILLDVMIPQLDGFATLKALRLQGYQGAILLVTSRGQERDKLQGLNNGADDYIVKPFLLSELVARIRAVVRRTTVVLSGAQSSVLKAGDLQMDLLKREVKRGGRLITLTKKEFDLLESLMRRPGQVISQTILSQHLSSNDIAPNTNVIEVHIKNLRTKLDVKSKKSLIRTVRGCGYALDV